MRCKAMWLSAACLLMISVAAQAQEEKKPPFEWKVSGDTVESFKAEFVVNTPIDQSTPEGVVNGYAQLTDSRTELNKHVRSFYTQGTAVVRNATKPLFEKLLSEEMLKAMLEAEAASDSKSEASYKAEATTITATADGKDGAKLLETLQKGSYLSEGWDPETGKPTGKMEEHTWETKYRYTCVKGDNGAWRIDCVEQMQKNWEKMDDEGNAPEEWKETTNVLYWYMNQPELPKAQELKQDTPENAALSLFHSAIQSRDNWTRETHGRGQKGWIDAVKTLFTEKGLKGPADSIEPYQPPSAGRDVDTVTDGADGIKKVKFLSRSDWAGPVEIHVKKVGDAWKVVNAGYYELEWTEMGEMKEGAFTENKSLDSLSWH